MRDQWKEDAHDSSDGGSATRDATRDASSNLPDSVHVQAGENADPGRRGLQGPDDESVGVGGALDAPSDESGAALPVGIQQLQIAAAYSGPLPSPADFAAFDHALPGAADRILAMAERRQAAEIANSERASRAESSSLRATAVAFAFLPYGLMACTIGLAIADVENYTVALSTLATVASFVPSVVEALRRRR